MSDLTDAEIDIRSVYEAEGGPLMAYWAKGHFPPEQFAAALRHQWDLGCDISAIEQAYQHFIPDGSCAWGGYYVIGYRRGRGWQPITHVDANKTQTV